MQITKSISLAGLAILVAGCSGGGSNGAVSGGSGSETPFTSGELQGRAAISNPPVSTSSAFCVATALTGTFSSLKLRELNPPLAETRIYFDTFANGHTNIFHSAIDGSDVQSIPDPGHTDLDPFVLPSGKVLFSSSRNGLLQIFSMNADGSSPTQIVVDGAGALFHVSSDAAGDKVSYILSGQVVVADLAAQTSSTLALPMQGTIKYAVLTPDGNTIYYAFDDGANSDYVYKQSLNPPSAAQQLFTIGFPEGMAMAPDGTEFAVACTGSPFIIDRFSTTFLSDDKIPMPGIFSFSGLSYSPDQKQFAFAYLPNGGTDRVATMSVDGGAFSTITPPLVDGEDPSWGPFTKDRVLIAAGGGMLGTRACGVIYGQQANHTTSVVAFDVTTPSSVVMTAQTPPNGTQPNLVFSIDADNITKLAYSNGYAWRGIRAVGSGTPVTTANGALVSLNAFDGTVVSILPFSGSRSVGSKPTFTDKGSVRTFTGQFLAVFDKDGKNLAPSGASTVKLDTTTNRLTIAG